MSTKRVMRFTVTKSALKWILLLSITTLVCYCDEWFDKELAKLEEGCMEMSGDALRNRYISIISIYKYSDNPEGYQYNKCYLRFQKLSNEEIKKIEETRKKVLESMWRDNEARQRQELEDRNQHQHNLNQNVQGRRDRRKSTNNTILIVLVFVCGLVFVGICVCAIYKRVHSDPITVSGAGQPMLPTHWDGAPPPTTLGFSPNDLDNQTASDRSATQVPRRSALPPATENSSKADARILVDEPPSYDEALRGSTPLPSAPPKGY